MEEENNNQVKALCERCQDTGLVFIGTQSHPFGSTYVDEPLYEPCDCKAGLLQMGYTDQEADAELLRIERLDRARVSAEQATADELKG